MEKKLGSLRGFLGQLSTQKYKIDALKETIALLSDEKRKSTEAFDRLKAEFEQHVKKNRSELLGTGKSAKTDAGDFGFKKSGKIELVDSEENVIEKLKKKFPANWDMYVQKKESLDKKAIATLLLEKQMTAVGLQTVDEVFWVKPK